MLAMKIVLTGPARAGKTTMLNQLIHRSIVEIPQTISMEITTHTIQVGEEQVKIEIWDTPGRNTLKLPLRLHWKDAAGAVVVFDLTDRASFEEANTYLCDLVAMCKENVSIILVGNKSDCVDARAITDEEVHAVKRRFGVNYMEISAKQASDVNNLFTTLVQGCLQRRAVVLPEQDVSNCEVSRRFVLSVSRLQQVASLDNNDFTFVVNGREYKCSRLQAVFLSQRVYRLLMSDRMIDRININIAEPGSFDEIMGLMYGQPIFITPENQLFFACCAHELENDELMETLVQFVLGKETNMSNVISHIKLKHEAHMDCQQESDFVAAHFCDMDFDRLAMLSSSELEQVVASSELTLESEDQLFSVIHRLIKKKGKSYAALLRYVKFQFLEKRNLKKFLGCVFPDYIEAVWDSIGEFLHDFRNSKSEYLLAKLKRYSAMSSNRKVIKATGDWCYGINEYLRSIGCGNPHTRELLEITASGTTHNNCHNLLDYGWHSCWCSTDDANSYVQFDFKNLRVCVRGYCLRSGNGSNGLRSWVLESSDDGKTWDSIDERNTDDLTGNFVAKQYKCQVKMTGYRQYFRIRQRGKNRDGNDILCLSELEFLGKISF